MRLITLFCICALAVGCVSTHKKEITIKDGEWTYSNEIMGSEGITKAGIDNFTVDYRKKDGTHLKAGFGKSYTSLEVEAMEKVVEAYVADPSLFQSLPGYALDALKFLAGR